MYRNFSVRDKVLVLAKSKPNNMTVNWIAPGTITGIISHTNYTIDIPEKRNKSIRNHGNLLKPCNSRPEFVNLLIDDEREVIEEESVIPSPI